MLPKEYAFFLLKFRLRSEKELYERLKRKKFPEEEIKKVILFLKKNMFLDDQAFAKAWVNSRLRRLIGLNKIREELKHKGVSKDIIDSKFEELKPSYNESKLVEELAVERFKRLKGIELFKARSRVYGYLIRRGFSPDTVVDTLNKLCKQTS